MIRLQIYKVAIAFLLFVLYIYIIYKKIEYLVNIFSDLQPCNQQLKAYKIKYINMFSTKNTCNLYEKICNFCNFTSIFRHFSSFFVIFQSQDCSFSQKKLSFSGNSHTKKLHTIRYIVAVLRKK